jgi:biopolymer transport protein ExbB
MNIPQGLETLVRWLTFIPILVCSVVGLSITLAKWLQFRKPNVPDGDAVEELTRLLADGDARQAADRVGTFAVRAAPLMQTAVALSGRGRDAIKEQMDLAGAALADELEYGLGALGLLAPLGPLFGLLGTVVGIVLVFNRLVVAGGAATPAELAGGIGTALYTTIAGLMVGILALVFHRYLSARADQLVAQLEAFGVRMVGVASGDRR